MVFLTRCVILSRANARESRQPRVQNNYFYTGPVSTPYWHRGEYLPELARASRNRGFSKVYVRPGIDDIYRQFSTFMTTRSKKCHCNDSFFAHFSHISCYFGKPSFLPLELRSKNKNRVKSKSSTLPSGQSPRAGKNFKEKIVSLTVSEIFRLFRLQ